MTDPSQLADRLRANATLLIARERELAQIDDHAPPYPLAELREMTHNAQEGAERVRRIVLGLKAFSRADEERRDVLDVRRLLDLSVDMVWNEIRHRAKLVKQYGDAPPIVADEARLGQVFINLLVNAAQALPDGQADRHEIRIVTRTDPDGRAIIELHDTGSGILPEHLARVFDPFFTTKPVGSGAGLGLSICHGIIAALHGEISVESKLGRGSVFRVALPPARAQLAATPRSPPDTFSSHAQQFLDRVANERISKPFDANARPRCCSPVRRTRPRRRWGCRARMTRASGGRR